MTTATTRGAERRLLTLAAKGRFRGGLYRDAAGQPVAATDGHVLVVLTDVRVWEPAADAHATALRVVAGLQPNLGALPSPLAVSAILRASQPVAETRRVLALDTAPDLVHGEGAVVPAGVLVGEAALDMRNVQKALRALGAKSAVAWATGDALDAVFLVADGQGIALVMPYRR